MKATVQLRIGWLFDGCSDSGHKDMLLTITGDRFTAVEQYHPNLVISKDRFQDLSACMIVPPLIDCHVHLCMSGTIDQKIRQAQLTAGYEDLLPVIDRHVYHLFSHGVLAVRDGGDRGDYVHRYLAEQPGNPEMVIETPGRGFHRRERYGRLIGRAVSPEETPAGNYEKDCGPSPARWVKVINSGLNSLKDYARETAPQFSVAELSELVRAAQRHGRKVMVHANGDEPVRRAIEAGCHSIEHGFFMGGDNLKRMADAGVFWVPTLYTMKAYRNNLAFVSASADAQVLDATIGQQLEQLALARELGVRVAVGSDSGSLGVLHGESLVEEIKLYRQVGFSMGEVMRCVSANGAELLGLADFGRISTGTKASFLIARGVPGQLPRKLSYLESVWVDGAPSRAYRKNPVKHVLVRGA